jgi:hypothetical protein
MTLVGEIVGMFASSFEDTITTLIFALPAGLIGLIVISVIFVWKMELSFWLVPFGWAASVLLSYMILSHNYIS